MLARKQDQVLFQSIVDACEFNSISSQWETEDNGQVSIIYDEQEQLARVEFAEIPADPFVIGKKDPLKASFIQYLDGKDLSEIDAILDRVEWMATNSVEPEHPKKARWKFSFHDLWHIRDDEKWTS